MKSVRKQYGNPDSHPLFFFFLLFLSPKCTVPSVCVFRWSVFLAIFLFGLRRDMLTPSHEWDSKSFNWSSAFHFPCSFRLSPISSIANLSLYLFATSPRLPSTFNFTKFLFFTEPKCTLPSNTSPSRSSSCTLIFIYRNNEGWQGWSVNNHNE